MNINLDNYEAFLLDFVEGQLSAEQEALLMQFLAEHPDLEVDLDIDIDALSLPQDDFNFDQKSTLFRNASNGLTLEEQLVALVEGDCTSKEKEQLMLLLSRWSDLEKEHALFRIAKLQAENVEYPWKELLLDSEPSEQELRWAAIFEGDIPGETISEQEKERFTLLPIPAVFEDKASLKKGAIVIPIQRWVAGLTAVAAILIAVFYIGFRDESPANSFYANNDLNIEFPKNTGQTRSTSPTTDAQVTFVKEATAANNLASSRNASANQEAQKQERYRPVLAMTGIQGIGTPKDLSIGHRESKELQFSDEEPENTLDVVNTAPPVNDLAGAAQPIEYTPLGEFITVKVKEELNIPKEMTAKDGINRLIDKAESKLSRKSKKEVILEAPKKESGKRSWNLRFGKLAFQRN